LLYFLGAHTNPRNGGAIHLRQPWQVVGETTGIASAILLAVVVILAGRLSILEVLFGDLTKVYVAHGVLGLLMFGLVSFHPIMYMIAGLASTHMFLTGTHVLVPFYVVAPEWASYILIAIAMVPTMFMRLSFDWWRTVHLLLGAGMILNGYAILIENEMIDTSQVPALRIYMLVLFGLGTLAFIWVAVVRRLVEPKREYRVVGAEYHPEVNAIEIRAKPIGKPMRFEAGQFTYVDLVDDRAPVRRDFEAHPFSVTSSPDKGEISLVIEGKGEHTDRILKVGEEDGARALLYGSFGRLVMRRPELKKQLWLAGGIGITPFLSMGEELAEHPERYEGYDVVLVVLWSHREQAFKRPQFVGYGEANPNFKAYLWNSDERGRFTIDAMTNELVPDLTDRAVMISGSDGMISGLTDQLTAAGVPRGHIRSERAIGPPGRWDVASPALRYMRAITTLWFALFVIGAAVATIGRAVGT
jgi:predicted ferric reductase